MSVSGWKYYNHAMIPSTAPHEECELPKDIRSLWKNSGRGTPLFARWTTDFDCGFETNWWYVIKDTPFDLSALKSNYRYKINKGIKNFEVHTIDPMKYVDELYEVFLAAYRSWPEKYRPSLTHDAATATFQKLSDDPSMVCYGAFFRETGELCGFMQAPTKESYVELQVQRVKPQYEKYQINAALVYGLLEDHQSQLGTGDLYILDGARSISHETNFQDYLEKYFGFRKAYCKLHILYNPKIVWMVKLLYPFRAFLQKFDEIGLVHQVNAVLKMEELVRG